VNEKIAICKLYVGPFLDNRQNGKIDTTILGTKRGGFGNPLGRVRDVRGADEFVRENIIYAARAAGIYAIRKPDSLVFEEKDGKWGIYSSIEQPDIDLMLYGKIRRLEVETLYNRWALANINLQLFDLKEGRSVWSKVMTNKESSGMGAGIFENTEKLKNWLAKIIQDGAFAIFESKGFQKVISQSKLE
jgi:hypothetical protein